MRLTTKSRLSKIHVVKRGTHNETWLKGGQAYWDAIKKFMVEALNNDRGSFTTIGAESSSTVEADSGSSIPIMPSGLMGIARESMRDSTEEHLSGKKKEALAPRVVK